jgi:hypothetical protein
MLKLVLPSEKELLLTYIITEDEYIGVMANAAKLKPIAAAMAADKITTHALCQTTLITCHMSIT